MPIITFNQSIRVTYKAHALTVFMSVFDDKAIYVLKHSKIVARIRDLRKTISFPDGCNH